MDVKVNDLKIDWSYNMNLKVNLGKTTDNQEYLIDFDDQNINLTLIVGSSGTGKSVLGYHIYKQLVDQNNPDEITFVLIDNVHLEFTQWNQQSPYLYCPVITNQETAFQTLESLVGKLSEINSGTKHYFIHIEECNQFAYDQERIQKILNSLLESKANNKIHIIFSTSRPSKEIFADWLLELADLKIIFHLPTSEDYRTITGQDLADNFTDTSGEKIVILNNDTIFLQPLSTDQVTNAQNFNL